MIGHLTGSLLKKDEKSVLLDVHGVGYLLSVPRTLAEKLTEGQAMSFFVYTHVREDEISLYGFEKEEEWRFFKLLLTVSGVGPKSALEILSVPLAQVKKAIAKKEPQVLTRIPGIGKKTAERIIIDLQEKIQHQELAEGESSPTDSALVSEDIIHALVSLGYHRTYVVSKLKKLPEEVASEEDIIKYFLRSS